MTSKICSFFLGNGENVLKKAYIWNMTAGTLNAFQSVIMLMIITRAVDLTAAGVFTIAYTTANLLLNLGLYGMRDFLVSDVAHVYSFREYRATRNISIAAMMVFVTAYMAVMLSSGKYDPEKCVIVILMTLLKAQDVFEDTYAGYYQNQERLDAGAKMTAIRMMLTIVSFGIVIVVTKSLLWTLVSVVLIDFAYLAVTLTATAPQFIDKGERCDRRNVRKLLVTLLPLCAGWFLSYYLGNAPKYAIDSLMTEEVQACFGFIAMPVWVVGVLSNFIFQPVLTKMTLCWNDGKLKELRKIVLKQAFYILLITLGTLAAGYFLGIPALSWMYNTDLSGYFAEFMVLLCGGGLYALSRYFVVVITLMRMQKTVAWCYLAVSAAAIVSVNWFVSAMGVMGACLEYIISMVLISVLLLVVVIYAFRKKRKQGEGATAK